MSYDYYRQQQRRDEERRAEQRRQQRRDEQRREDQRRYEREQQARRDRERQQREKTSTFYNQLRKGDHRGAGHTLGISPELTQNWQTSHRSPSSPPTSTTSYSYTPTPTPTTTTSSTTPVRPSTFSLSFQPLPCSTGNFICDSCKSPISLLRWHRPPNYDLCVHCYSQSSKSSKSSQSSPTTNPPSSTPTSTPPPLPKGRPAPVKGHPHSMVKINGVGLSPAQIMQLQLYMGTVLPGSYWYDSACGAWGRIGTPVLGYVLPGLPLPGPVSRNASNGHSGVIVNGRELQDMEVGQLLAVGVIVTKGHWWVDANGNLGKQGSKKPTANLAAIVAAIRQAKQRQQQSSGQGLHYFGDGVVMGSVTSSDGRRNYTFL